MPIAINGSGTVTGISVGGLPDGIVDTDMIAAAAVTAPKRGSGAIIQVASTTKTDTFSSSESAGNVSGPAISLNFTATSTSNKLLIMANLFCGHSNGTERVGIILYAGGSVLSGAVGDSNGTSNRLISMGGFNDQDNSYVCVSHSHLFTPSNTNQITYDYRLNNGRGATGTVYLNRQSTSNGGSEIGVGTSTITIMESAG